MGHMLPPLSAASVVAPVDPRTTAPSARPRQWYAALVVNLAAICAGTAVAWSAPTLPVLQGTSEDVGAWAGTWVQALLPARALTDSEGALVAALVPLGALIGAVPAGALVPLVGLRRPLLALAVLFALSWALILLGGLGGVRLILAGRAVQGVATGATTVLVPRYCDEMAEVEVRGALGALLDLSMCNGVLLAYVAALALPYGLLTLLVAALPLLFAAAFAFLPESPVQLVRTGRRKEALEALAWFRPGWSRDALCAELSALAFEDADAIEYDKGVVLSPVSDTPPPDYDAALRMSARGSVGGASQVTLETCLSGTSLASETAETLPSTPPAQHVRHRLSSSPPPIASPEPAAASRHRPSPPPASEETAPPPGCATTLVRKVKDISISSTAAKGLFISCTLMFFQQAAAISAVIAYATQIFTEAGGALSPRVATVVLGALQSAGGVVAALSVERAGRRPLLVGSLVVVSASLAVLAIVPSSVAPWLPPVALGVYIGTFEIGIGPLPWFIAAELVGPAASGAPVCVNWATAALVTELFPGLSLHLGQRAVFGGFAVMALLGIAFSLLLVPETRGKTRAQLMEALRRWPRRSPPTPAPLP